MEIIDDKQEEDSDSDDIYTEIEKPIPKKTKKKRKKSDWKPYRPLFVHFGLVFIIIVILFGTIVSMGNFLYALLISVYLLLIYIPSTIIIWVLCYFRFTLVPWIFIGLDCVSILVVIILISVYYDKLKQAANNSN